MLPSSHLAPINEPLANSQGDGQFHESAAPAQPYGHGKSASCESETQSPSAVMLASEFSEFIRAASRLEDSYRALQMEVSELGIELSERNAALQASLEQNERMRLELQQIVDSMPCGVLVVDRDGQLAMINPESMRLLGFDGIRGAEASKTTLKQISVRSGVNLESCYKSESDSEAEQQFCVHTPTEKRWLGIRKRRLFYRSSRKGAPDQTILILADITAQKRAEQEREAARRAMTLAEITTILAHEIRNPLASLELFAELIEEDGEGRSEWISNLRAGIRSLSGTVNNVLSFHGSGSLTLTPLSLPALIGDAIRFAQPLANQASVSLDMSAEPGAAQVMGNEGALRQVVLNIISNAIRHTPAGGSVTVSVRSERDRSGAGTRTIAEFTDSGCGIRPDQIDRIFEPGFSGRGDSSGLGLAVCERIMLQHGARISAANCARSGARFTLDFPVSQMELATA